ncbi:hypothetical protein AND_010527 [Anopheles darlingi]|uniref:TraG P-loop domain-containing protein n=1 Tax=Anopheles darlingi TaxID=43151 RepID=W5J2E7_ANODA|nr:hypothetical protein AND_010527 [Anopheles darlingi]
MGRVVDLVNPKTQEIIPSLISRDRLTNELVAYKVENIRIPDEIKGIRLDEAQKQTLIEGKALYLEGMISTKGEPFNAHVQFNADKKYVEFLFDHKQEQQQSQIYSQTEIPKTFRGKELNEDQYERFKAGQTIYIDGLLDKKNQPYQGYITLNQENGKIDFSFQNPDKIQQKAKPTQEHTTQTAVNSEGKTNEATKHLKEPLQKGQQSPKDKSQEEITEISLQVLHYDFTAKGCTILQAGWRNINGNFSEDIEPLEELPELKEDLLDSIGSTIEVARQNAVKAVNTELVKANWEIGRHIVEYEQHGEERAEYGSNLLATLSKDLRQRYGKGFGRRNILDMRRTKHLAVLESNRRKGENSVPSFFKAIVPLLKGIRKLILIEEAWKAIAKEGMAEYIKYLFKTVRKFFGEAIVVTQEVDDIIQSPIVKESIINNSDCKILLDQRKYMNKFDDIQAMLGLTDKEKSQVLSINMNNDPKRLYKEVWIGLGGTHSAVYATETSSTVSNVVKNFNEVKKVYEQGKEYYDKLKAVNNLVKDARKVQQTVLLVGDVSEIINGVLNPIVQGSHAMLEGQVLDLNELQQKKDLLEREAMLRNPEMAYLISDEEFDRKLEELGWSPSDLAGGAGNFMRNVSQMAQRSGNIAGAAAGSAAEAAEREPIPASTSINNQLELMEKSYQMAAKYFPTSKPEDLFPKVDLN